MQTHLTLTAQLEREYLSPQGGPVWLLLLMGAPQPEEAPDRGALNLATVLDRSGSMHGPKLLYTQEALYFLVDQMVNQDLLSITTFDDQVQRLLPLQPVLQKEHLKGLVSQIRSGGTTNLSGGLVAGMQELATPAGSARIRRVLLMTDGQANVGVTDPATLIKWVGQWRQRGVGLSALGVGEDFNEDLLAAMAEAGGGHFHYIADPEQIPAIFAQELQGLVQVAAQGLNLHLEAAPGVAIGQIFGYKGPSHAAEAHIDLPDLYMGEVKPLLLQLHVPAQFQGAHLLRAALHYLPATAEGAPESLELRVQAQVAEDPALLERAPNESVSRQVRLFAAQAAWEEALRLADQGQQQAGAEYLQEAAQRLEELALQGDLLAEERLGVLRSRAAELSQAPYDSAMRKRLKQEESRHRRGG